MTVKELKSMLENLPDDMEVFHSRDAYSHAQYVSFCGKQTAYKDIPDGWSEFFVGKKKRHLCIWNPTE